MSGNGKGFTLEELFRSHSLSSDQAFLSIPLETFQSSVDGLYFIFFFAFELWYSLFHISKAAIGLTELFSIFLIGHNWF